MKNLTNDFNRSNDVIIRRFSAGGYRFSCVSMEGMINKEALERQVIERIICFPKFLSDGEKRFEQVYYEAISSPDVQKIYDRETAYEFLMGGMALVFCDGYNGVITVGVHGFPRRTVNEPISETMERASREGFVEVLRENIAMVRRRIKSTDLVFESHKAGWLSNTNISIFYLKSAVSKSTLDAVKKKIKNNNLQTVLESGFLQPFLEEGRFSLFSTVGVTERPDTACGKIAEGRIAILIDGTPFCLFAPFLFSENFQNFDDYTMNPFFVTFIRILKYFSFFLATLLPGIYVAIAEFNPEIFPSTFFYKVVESHASTPFSFMSEALLIHTIYEIMREAGLRLPKSVGHAVSIVGALVIGEAAVTAGLMGAPMIIIVAITALASYVTPSLYYPVAILRLVFILIGGFSGLYGVILLFAALVVYLCSLSSFGVPYTAPLSPFDKRSMRDTIVRAGWKMLSKRTAKIQNLNGSNISEETENGNKE